jgi:hypothetical protein
MTSTEPGWYSDPFGRHQHRYWDGAAWSASVSDGGITATDPATVVPPPSSGPAPVAAAAAPNLDTHMLNSPPPPAPQRSTQTAHKPRWRRKRDEKFAEAMRPHLDQGEEVREIFMGCTSIPVFGGIGWTRKRLIVVTDRSVCLFSKSHASFGVKELLYKARLGDVAVDCGATSLKVGESQRVYVNLDSGLGVRKRVAAMINQGTATGGPSG